MKRIFCLTMVVVVLLTVLLAACAAPTPTPTPTPKPTPTPTPTPSPTPKPTPTPTQPEVIVLKMSNYSNPPPADYGNAIDWWMRRIETATFGRIKFEEYWTATLLEQKTEPEAVQAGMADVAFFQSRYQPSRLPLFYITNLSATARDVRASCFAQNDLAELPAVHDEFAQWNMVWLAPGTGCTRGVYTMNKPIRKLDDFKGMKIRAEATAAKILESLGATAVSISSSDVFEAASKGTVEGICTPITGGTSWKWDELSKYYWDGNLEMTTMCGWMNKKTWDSLPKDIQQVFIQVRDNEMPLMYDYYLRAKGNSYGLYERFPALGIEVTRPSAAEVAKIEGLAESTWETHINEVKAKGLPAQEVLDEWIRLNRYYEDYLLVAGF